MSDAEHAQIHRDLGVYVLGALEPADRSRLEQHLSGCALCRDELADLAVLPSLLARLGEPAAAVPVPSFEPIVARIAAERRRGRRRERLFAAVAAAAVLAVVVVLVGIPQTSDVTGEVYATADGAVTATVEQRPWGMAVHIAAAELPKRNGYIAQAVARDGHRTQVASWSATGRPVRVTGACYLDAKDLDRVEILDPADDAVLAVLTPT